MDFAKSLFRKEKDQENKPHTVNLKIILHTDNQKINPLNLIANSFLPENRVKFRIIPLG